MKKAKSVNESCSMPAEELIIWQKVSRKCTAMKPKKGKGSYNRRDYKKVVDKD